MATQRFKSIAELERKMQKDLREREARIERAVRLTAQQGAAVMRRKVPVAFSELRDSVRAEGTRIIADAPHAAAVNNGSRPHFPPLEPIIKWVKLRGAQGLVGKRSLGRMSGSTTADAASAVASMISSYETRGRSVNINVPRRIAYAIALKISKEGTKPHNYVEKTMPEVMVMLDKNIKASMKAPL